MIPQETVRLIEDTARIEEVVGDFVTLKRRGASYVACCPFHNEKTPSFHVTPSKGIFKCFGCGKVGSSIGFVMEYEHCSYPEALRYLANKYHIEIQEQELTAEEIARRTREDSLKLVMEFAQKFYTDAIFTGEGRNVGLAYLHGRGLEDETIRKFGLGWAPSDRDALVKAALGAGYKEEYLIDAGLAVKQENGTLIDNFRERVMFPIHSVSGRIIAYSGRTLKADNPAKYKNSPETDIYKKNRSLLGIYFAKSEIARAQKCYLVEGNVDVITMQQLGITNVVASCGTSLTPEQIRLIHKFTENLTILYDGDGAGIHAAIRAIDMVLAEGMNVKVVLLPDGEDPDSFGRSHTLEEFNGYIASHERDFISFKTDLGLERTKGDPKGRANLINEIADTIATIPDAIARREYAQDCARKLGTDSHLVLDRVEVSHRKAVEAAARQTEREQQRDFSRTPVPTAQVESAAVVDVNSNQHLLAVEEELLIYILRYGRDPLEFPTDSPYYTEDQVYTVADFIRESLYDNSFANKGLALTYDAYFQSYDQGKDQNRIIQDLLNSPDEAVRSVASRLSVEKYQLSYQKFSDSLTSRASWLSMNIPKSILVYQQKVLQDRISTLKAELSGADETDMTRIFTEMKRYQATMSAIKEKLQQ